MGNLQEEPNMLIFDDILKIYLKEFAKEAYNIYVQRAKDYSYVDDESLFSNEAELREITAIQNILDSNNIDDIIIKSRELRDKNPYKHFAYMKQGNNKQKTKFLKELLNTEINVLRDVLKLHQDYRDDKVIEPLHNPPRDEQLKKQEEPQDSHIFSKMIPLFIEDQKVEKSWGEKNIKRNEAELQIALQILGDKELSHYKRDDFIDFRSVLMQLPSNIKKIQKFQNKSYRDIAKLNSKSKEFKTIETNTLNTKLIIISAFFGWAELHQYIDKNYTKRLSIKSKEKMIDKKLPFTCQDIDVALPLLYGDKDMYIKNPERVWLVMIGFLNGMRLEEIAQLHIDDIYQKEDIWVFDINTKPNHKGIEKLVKNNQSIRIIPVHPTLIRLGFIDYIKKMKQQKHPRPWMKLKHGNHGFGRNTAYWFNKEIKKIAEIKDVNKKTFHGTRHTFIQKAKDAKVDIHVYKAIVGHYESDIDYNTYGKAITPEQMLEELVKIEYPIIEEFFTRKLLV